MTIVDYIKEYYPIADRVEVLLSDPYKLIENADDLPYDKIGMDDDGNLTKLVCIDDERTISVLDLISLSEKETEDDPALKSVYEIYMQQIEIEQVNITDILACTKEYKRVKQQQEERANVLHLQQEQ